MIDCRLIADKDNLPFPSYVVVSLLLLPAYEGEGPDLEAPCALASTVVFSPAG